MIIHFITFHHVSFEFFHVVQTRANHHLTYTSWEIKFMLCWQLPGIGTQTRWQQIQQRRGRSLRRKKNCISMTWDSVCRLLAYYCPALSSCATHNPAATTLSPTLAYATTTMMMMKQLKRWWWWYKMNNSIKTVSSAKEGRCVAWLGVAESMSDKKLRVQQISLSLATLFSSMCRRCIKRDVEKEKVRRLNNPTMVGFVVVKVWKSLTFVCHLVDGFMCYLYTFLAWKE